MDTFLHLQATYSSISSILPSHNPLQLSQTPVVIFLPFVGSGGRSGATSAETK